MLHNLYIVNNNEYCSKYLPKNLRDKNLHQNKSEIKNVNNKEIYTLDTQKLKDLCINDKNCRKQNIRYRLDLRKKYRDT